MASERIIQKNIQNWLKRQGWFVRKWHQGPYAGAGMPDLYALKDGHSIHIEVKAPGGKLTALQEHTIKKIQDHGGIVIVVTSVDEVKKAIQQFEKIWKEEEC